MWETTLSASKISLRTIEWILTDISVNNICLQLINIWNEPELRCLSELMSLSKHKTTMTQSFGVVVAEPNFHHITYSNYTRPVFKTLAWKANVAHQSLWVRCEAKPHWAHAPGDFGFRVAASGQALQRQNLATTKHFLLGCNLHTHCRNWRRVKREESTFNLCYKSL